MVRFAFSIASLALGFGPAGPATPLVAQEVVDTTVDYALSPIFEGAALAAVAVEMRLTGDADGATRIELPDQFAGQTAMWRHLSDLSVAGAAASRQSGAALTLEHDPGAAITIRYRVASAYVSPPGDYAKGGAIIRPGWFASFGEALFASVEGRQREPARFAWIGWPKDWNRASDLDPGFIDPTLDEGGVVESTLLAGPGVRVVERALPGGTLQVGMRGNFDFSDERWADTLAEVIGAQRRFWADDTARGPFTVTLNELADLTPGSSAGGTGRSDAFAMEATADIPFDTLVRIIAHEYNHTWLPRRIGELPKVDEPLAYWLSEGVTDFYTGRILRGADIWSAEEFTSDFNEMLARHAASPARALPNGAIAEGFWQDRDIQQLPYDRGRLFALLVDYRLRQTNANKSGGARTYDDLLRIMRDAWAAAPAGAKPDLRANFTAAAMQSGLDIEPLIANHIDRGEAIDLPRDILGPCGTLETVTISAFDPGFDRAASTASGIISGVVPAGNAERAGLRNGMVRVDFIRSTEGDSRREMAYRIRDETGERAIAWLPAGEGTVTFPELALAEGAVSSACKAVMAGAAAASR